MEPGPTGSGRRRRLALMRRASPLCFFLLTSLATAADPSPAWVREGLVVASDMEALSFVLRRGGASARAVEEWHSFRTEATVRKLKDLGVNLWILNLHKGAGLKAEAADMDSTRRTTELAHRHGIRVAGYVGASMMYETFFAEEPEARQWRQVDEFGRPIYYAPDQTFRYMACRNHPGYMDFLKRVIRVGLEDLKLDALHFDQMQCHSEPRSCRCEHCRRQFRAFLAQRYADPGRTRLRLGFPDLSGFAPPPYDNQLPSTLRNPLMQEWALFRAWSLARQFAELRRTIKGINPQAAIIGNATRSLERNVGFLLGVDMGQLGEQCDILFSEEGNLPEWTADGRLVSQIRSYKSARSLGRTPLFWQGHFSAERYRTAPAVLRLAESLAYGDANLGALAGYDAGGNEASPEIRRYASFLHRHAGELSRTGMVADAAVLRAFASTEFSPWQSNFATLLAEQTLIQHKVPFTILFDSQLSALERYKVLVLAEQDALSDEQIARIRAYVQNGGGLVATGATSQLTEWRTVRPSPGLGDLFGPRRSFGKGRVAYLPRIEPDTPEPPARFPAPVGNSYWKLPRNASALVEAVRWAAGGTFSAEVEAPLWVTAELTEQEGSGNRLLHLVNFRHREPLEDLPVRLRLPPGKKLQRAVLCSPEQDSETALPASATGGAVSFRVPRLGVYALVKLLLD